MKWIIAGCAAVAMMLSLNTPASAIIIFQDDFNRADSDTVGNGWVEAGGNADDVSILGNELHLGKNQTPQGTQGTNVLSTVGLTAILLDYDWRGIGTEAGDTITVYWSSDGTTFNLLATHDLGSPAAFVHNQVGLGVAAENLADISIRFQLNANMGNDFAHIDNVVVSGTGSITQAPEPGTLALLGLGLAGLGLVRRRRTI